MLSPATTVIKEMTLQHHRPSRNRGGGFALEPAEGFPKRNVYYEQGGGE